MRVVDGWDEEGKECGLREIFDCCFLIWFDWSGYVGVFYGYFL